jgi:hypothetical protein
VISTIGDAIVLIVAALRAFGKPTHRVTVRETLVLIHPDIWGPAVRHLRGNGHMTENQTDWTWSLNESASKFDTSCADFVARKLVDAQRKEG